MLAVGIDTKFCEDSKSCLNQKEGRVLAFKGFPVP